MLQKNSRINTRIYYALILLVVTVAGTLQLLLFHLGVYYTLFDESAHSLTAYQLDWDNAFRPGVWPPFYKWFVGLLLKIYDDVFYVPRVLVFIFGLLIIILLAQLSQELFNDRRISLLTAILSVLIPHRLIFSVAPMSEIFYYLFMIAAAVFVISWLRRCNHLHIVLACLFLFLASTVRYEACFASATLGLFIFYLFVFRKEVPISIFMICGLILAAFPGYWMFVHFYWHGSLENVFVTRMQYMSIFGNSYARALKSNALTRFGVDLISNPVLLLGIGAMVKLFITDRPIRWWIGVFFGPLLILTTVMVATLSIPGASPWRMAGIWTLLTIPFTAFSLVWVTDWQKAHVIRRRRVLLILTIVAVIPFGIRSAAIAWKAAAAGATRQERQVGLYFRDQLAQQKIETNVLIDSTNNLGFLNVITNSSSPNRFILNAGEDPVQVGVYVPMRDHYYREGNTEIIEKYFTDKFDLAHGGSTEKFDANHIGYVVVKNSDYVRGLDKSPLVMRASTFGNWVIYIVTANTVPEYEPGS